VDNTIETIIKIAIEAMLSFLFFCIAAYQVQYFAHDFTQWDNIALMFTFLTLGFRLGSK